MHNSLSLKLGRGAIPGCGFEPNSRPNLPPVGNRPNRRPAGRQPVTASRTCETGSCARILPRKVGFFLQKRCPGLRRPQERPAKNKRVPGPAPRPGNGEKAVAVAIKTATGTENPFRKTWQASTSISLLQKSLPLLRLFLRHIARAPQGTSRGAARRTGTKGRCSGVVPGRRTPVPGESPNRPGCSLPNSPDHDLPNGPDPGFPNQSGKRSGRHNPLRRKPDRDALLRRRHAEPAHAA